MLTEMTLKALQDMNLFVNTIHKVNSSLNISHITEHVLRFVAGRRTSIMHDELYENMQTDRYHYYGKQVVPSWRQTFKQGDAMDSITLQITSRKSKFTGKLLVSPPIPPTFAAQSIMAVGLRFFINSKVLSRSSKSTSLLEIPITSLFNPLSSLTIAEPTKPEPPATKIVMGLA